MRAAEMTWTAAADPAPFHGAARTQKFRPALCSRSIRAEEAVISQARRMSLAAGVSVSTKTRRSFPNPVSAPGLCTCSEIRMGVEHKHARMRSRSLYERATPMTAPLRAALVRLARPRPPWRLSMEHNARAPRHSPVNWSNAPLQRGAALGSGNT